MVVNWRNNTPWETWFSFNDCSYLSRRSSERSIIIVARSKLIVSLARHSRRLPGRHNFWSTWAAVLKRGEFRPRGIAPYYEANVGDSSLFWIIREKRRHSIWASVLSLFLLYRAPCTFNDGAEWSYQTHSHSSHLFFFLENEMNSALMGNCTSRRRREPTTISIVNTARKCAWQCTSKLVYNTY